MNSSFLSIPVVWDGGGGVFNKEYNELFYCEVTVVDDKDVDNPYQLWLLFII